MGTDGQYVPYNPPRPPSGGAPRGLAAFAVGTLAAPLVPFGLLCPRAFGSGRRAREWLIPNYRIEELGNVTRTLIE